MGEIVTVNFRGDDLYGFREDDGVFLAVKPMVEAMGLTWHGQWERLQRDPVLSKAIRVMRIPFGRGGPQETTCLKLDRVNFWLATVDSSRIKDEEVKRKVILYQEECADVLHAHFTGKHKPAELDGDPDENLSVAERLRLVTEARQTFDTLAARQLWFKQGLPIVPAMMQPEQMILDWSRVKTNDLAGAEAANG